MNLYEIDEAIQAAFDAAVDPETGEIIDESKLDELDSLQMDRDQKIENICLWIKDLDAEETALANEERSFQKRKLAARNKKESLKRYAGRFLDGQKFKSADGKVSVSFRASKSVSITNEGLIPDYYKKQVIEFNKADIRKALLNGDVVPGAELQENRSIIIR